MADVLEKIYSDRRARVAKDKAARSLGELERIAKDKRVPSLKESFEKVSGIALIAEMKRKSPSAGAIREPFDVVSIGKSYEKAGARGISVLTEPDHFGGSLQDLEKVAAAVAIPVLRKDFVFDPYQIIEAKAAGAAAVLLIAEMLDEKLLNELVDCALGAGIEPLLEIFTEENLPAALKTKATLIGINSRNLKSLEMRPDNFKKLAPRVPKDRLVVAESGIKSGESLQGLKDLGIKAILVGESLLKQADVEQAARKLVEAGK